MRPVFRGVNACQSWRAWCGIVLMHCVLSGGALAHGGDDAEARIASPLPTAIVVASTNAPLRISGSDGLVHLEYDLVVTNIFTAPVTLTSLTVLGDNDEPLLRLDGAALADVVEHMLGGKVSPDAYVATSGSVGVVVDVPVRPGQVPKRLSHRIAYAVPPDAYGIALIGRYEVDGPTLAVSSAEQVVISPPLRGSGWFSVNGCCRPNPHRSLRVGVAGLKLLKEETFAIDYVQLKNGSFFAGDGSANTQHYAYGQPLLAVADGVVAAVRTDLPDEQPFQTPPLNVKQPIDYVGNQVVLRIGPRLWAIYGHMLPGSATVRVGQRVRAGQVLGKLGNSGNTTLPHLHFELADNPVNVSASSVPYVFDDYLLQGYVPPEAMQAPPGPAGLPILGTPKQQRRTHPLVLTVSAFD